MTRWASLLYLINEKKLIVAIVKNSLVFVTLIKYIHIKYVLKIIYSFVVYLTK